MKFDYLLNAFERAAQQDVPAEHGYANKRMAVLDYVAECDRLLQMAAHALRSYQYGNAATDLAADQANAIEKFLATGEPQTLAGKRQRP